MIVAFVWVGTRVTGSVPSLVLSLAEVVLLVAIFFIDIATHLIPTVFVAVLVLLALGAAALGFGPGFHSSVLGGALGFAGFGILVLLARMCYGEGALGMGDANLALAIGCITGYPLVVLTLCVGAVLGAITALFVLLGAHLRGHAGRTRRTAIPYAPFLICATVLSMAHVLIL